MTAISFFRPSLNLFPCVSPANSVESSSYFVASSEIPVVQEKTMSSPKTQSRWTEKTIIQISEPCKNLNYSEFFKDPPPSCIYKYYFRCLDGEMKVLTTVDVDLFRSMTLPESDHLLAENNIKITTRESSYYLMGTESEYKLEVGLNGFPSSLNIKRIFSMDSPHDDTHESFTFLEVKPSETTSATAYKNKLSASYDTINKQVLIRNNDGEIIATLEPSLVPGRWICKISDPEKFNRHPLVAAGIFSLIVVTAMRVALKYHMPSQS